MKQWLRDSFLVLTTALLIPCATIAGSFDGITIIELADRDGQRIIKGHDLGSDPYLVTYVAATGTYASLTNGREQSCVSWAQQGSYTGDSIRFGVPPTQQSIRLSYPHVCQPFTLTRESNDMVRVQGENPVGLSSPLESGAQVLRYSRRHKVVARAPLIAVDWSNPLYQKYTIKGVRLGPLPAVQAGLNAGAKLQLSELQVTHEGARKAVLILNQTAKEQINWIQVKGEAVAAERLSWPWDVLYGTMYFERLPQRSTIQAFDDALWERYGKSSLTEAPFGRARRDHYWLFDLAGDQVTAKHENPDSCRETLSLWKLQEPLARVHDDIGPWNCSLVVHVRDDGGASDRVSEYRIEMMSGYTAALNHFAWRLEQLRELREKLEGIHSRPAEL